MTETIDITPAPVVRARADAYMRVYELDTYDQIFPHVTGRLTQIAGLCDALRAGYEAREEFRGGTNEEQATNAGFLIATVAVEAIHKRVSEEFLNLWRPMPDDGEREHSTRVSTSSNNDGNEFAEQPFWVWLSWGNEREIIMAQSGLDAISRYAVSNGYVRYDENADLLETVTIEGDMTSAVYENSTIFAQGRGTA